MPALRMQIPVNLTFPALAVLLAREVITVLRKKLKAESVLREQDHL